MLDTTTFIGLDVHARSIKAVSLDVMTGEVRAATFGYDAGAVAGWVRSVDPGARCVYESGVTGFDLQKRLTGLGVDCVVGAVSKMVKPSADRRRKNDRNDAEFLARMLSVGNVVEVWVPDDECEAARDLTRALEDARDDLSRAKQRLSKFLLRHGLVFDERTPTGRRKGNWTRAHWSWIESIRFAEGVLASIYFSPFSPTYFRQSRQRGCAGFANADAPLSASRPPPPSRPHRRWIRPSGGTTVPLS
mgnify:CR=1 FL=1